MTAPLLDLDYPITVPAGLADRARTLGRRRRRVRRTTLTLVVAGTLAFAAPLTGLVPAPGRGAVVAGGPVGDLPARTAPGGGPDPQSLTAPGFVFSEDTTDHPVRGVPLRAGTAGDGRDVVLYLTKDAWLCVGDRAPYAAADEVSPSSCDPLKDLPAEGIYPASLSGDAGADDSRLFVTGLVRGPVTRVAVESSRGETDADLAPAAAPGLGTLFAVAPGVGFREGDTIRITVYRGDVATFSCSGAECGRRF